MVSCLTSDSLSYFSRGLNLGWPCWLSFSEWVEVHPERRKDQVHPTFFFFLLSLQCRVVRFGFPCQGDTDVGANALQSGRTTKHHRNARKRGPGKPDLVSIGVRARLGTQSGADGAESPSAVLRGSLSSAWAGLSSPPSRLDTSKTALRDVHAPGGPRAPRRRVSAAMRMWRMGADEAGARLEWGFVGGGRGRCGGKGGLDWVGGSPGDENQGVRREGGLVRWGGRSRVNFWVQNKGGDNCQSQPKR